jgi:ABC-2 type transport system permease protein
MKNVLTIAQRELAAYFTSPIAYVVGVVFLLINGVYFIATVLYFSQPSQFGGPPPEPTLRYQIGLMFSLLLFATPFLTMRLLAEEQRMGTLELLLTAPVRDWEVVLGKFLAALGLLGVILVLTLAYVGLLNAYSNPDMGPVIAGYIGLILAGAALFSIGVFASSLTQNQIVAALVCFGIILVLYLIGVVAQSPSTPLASLLSQIDFSAHLNNFESGVISTPDIAYFLSVSVGFLFIATRVLESRRWR